MAAGFVDLILTVCTLAQPDVCQDQRHQFVDAGSLRQCMYQAPLFMANWADEHPDQRIAKWRCSYTVQEDKKI